VHLLFAVFPLKKLYFVQMLDERTTVAVQRYLDELATAPADRPIEPIIGALLGRAVHRLHALCGNLLVRSYPRLMRPPLNLQADEMLSAVVERLLKAMRGYRPQNVRQFFALANQHMRWELNDLARRLDKQETMVELHDSFVPDSPPTGGSKASPNTLRILEAIDSLPEEEREVFSLVRIQGVTHAEAAELLGVSAKTIQRRLNRSLLLLSETLEDLSPALGSSKPC
jgi:RNA polymerase sigma-70 factor (ECF subfamily)